MVSSTPIPGLEHATVDSLRSEDGLTWDRDLLLDIFEQWDVQLIQGILISFRRVPDKVCWRWEESGRFSVRSCYQFLAGEMTNGAWSGWTAMWGWSLPPKIKNFFWQVCCGFLPTMANLRLMRVNYAESCGLCGQG
ncbi:unnamed protein product, partial [Cuscuta epithymum]